MSLVEKANQIINSRSEEKTRQYGPMIEGMKAATNISEFLNIECDKESQLNSFRYLYGLKLSRQKYNHKEDNLLDAIAYRISEINAILEDNGYASFTIEEFNKAYIETTGSIKYENSFDVDIINSLTQLNLKGDDIYKIYLGLEMTEERIAISKNHMAKRIASILKQIHILNLMNSYNVL